jgi:non-ribosomal peptide synthetase component F
MMDLEFHGLDGLSLSERILFHQFGKGADEAVPFTHVHHAFEHFAYLHPSAIAVQEHDGASITYGELERRSNILSNMLISNGLLPRQRVCLVMQRSIHMVVAIMAVLKSNCQYIPLDGGVVPDETLAHILSDTQAPLVLCLKKFEAKIRRHAKKSAYILCLDGEHQFLNGDETRPTSKDLIPNDGAYIIYTSGTRSHQDRRISTD